MTSPLNRSETRSISIPAPPAAVVEFVGDGANLPRWAPAFAPAVRRDGSVWIIESGDRRTRIRLRVAPEHGTVDIVSAEQPTRGAFLRAIPNVDGCELLFTLLFAPETDGAAVREQMATVERELETVRSLCSNRREG